MHLSDEEFFALTPRQFSWLMDAHKKRLAHAEMIQAQTTAAVINYAFSPPSKPVQPVDLTFNFKHRKPEHKPVKVKKYTESEIIDWQTRVANLASEMKRGGGPMLEEIMRNSDG